MKLWIARDLTGELYLYNKEPEKSHICYILPYGHYLTIDDNLFPEVTFKNSPMEVELKLVKEE